MSPPLIRVCLLWHGLDSQNLGVRALTESQLHLIRSAASAAGKNVSFEVVGWAASTDPGPFRLSGVERVTPVCGRSMISSAGVYAAFQRSKVILDIGEGDSFTDIYGPKRLAYFSATKILAAMGRRQLILCPQTIGPFAHWWSRILSDYCLNRAAQIFPRDKLSSRYLESRRLRTPFEEVVDVAFALPYRQHERKGGNRPSIGINVSGLLWSGGYTGNNQFGLTVNYRALMRRLIAYFLDTAGADVTLVPHVLGEESAVDGDLGVCRELAAEFQALKVAPVFSGPSDAKSFISGLDFFVGARMHACIAAFSSGVPVVPLAYSRKFKGLFDTLGYPYVAECQQQSDEDVFRLVTGTYSNLEAVRPYISRGNRIAKERLDRYVEHLSETLLNA